MTVYSAPLFIGPVGVTVPFATLGAVQVGMIMQVGGSLRTLLPFVFEQITKALPEVW